jgi:energy-converting hydrogenase Eha subunit A
VAAIFLGCVTIILHLAFLFQQSSRIYCGTCVVFPTPVAAVIIVTEFPLMVSMISC